MAVKLVLPVQSFSRALLLAAGAVIIPISIAFGQGDGTHLDSGAQSTNAITDPAAFDVVSIKPIQPGGKITMVGLRYTPDGIEAGNVTVSMLVRAAYGGFTKLPTEDSVTRLPEWGKTETFNVEAKMSPDQAAAFGKLSKDEQEERREAMLRSMLEDRFKLKVHREPKQAPDYELVVAKGGPKLKEGDTNSNAPKDRDGKPITGSFLMMRRMGQVQAQAFSMDQLANFLGQGQMGLGRMVKDKTELTGKYSFALNWTPDPALGSGTMDGLLKAPQATTDEGGPSIFTALEEQLGLKLQPGTGTIDLVVVEHVERPTED